MVAAVRFVAFVLGLGATADELDCDPPVIPESGLKVAFHENTLTDICNFQKPPLENNDMASLCSAFCATSGREEGLPMVLGSEHFGFNLAEMVEVCTNIAPHNDSLSSYCGRRADSLTEIQVKAAQFVAKVNIFKAEQVAFRAGMQQSADNLRQRLESEEFQIEMGRAVDKAGLLKTQFTAITGQAASQAGQNSQLLAAIRAVKAASDQLSTVVNSNLAYFQEFVDNCNTMLLATGSQSEFLLDICGQQNVACIDDALAGHVGCCCGVNPLVMRTQSYTIDGVSAAVFGGSGSVGVGRRLSGESAPVDVCGQAKRDSEQAIADAEKRTTEMGGAALIQERREKLQSNYPSYYSQCGSGRRLGDDNGDERRLGHAEAWAVVTSGGCTLDDELCIASPGYPFHYPDRSACTIEVDGSLAGPIWVKAFSTESCCDILRVNGQAYSGLASPAGVTPTGTITWSADGSVRSSGWKLCHVQVYYNNYFYRTLDGTLPSSSSQGCQESYMAVPSGWELAGWNTDSRHVAASYNWGTQMIALGFVAGEAVNTPLYGGSYDGGHIDVSGVRYMPNACNLRILIRKEVPPTPTASPTASPTPSPTPSPTASPTVPPTPSPTVALECIPPAADQEGISGLKVAFSHTLEKNICHLQSPPLNNGDMVAQCSDFCAPYATPLLVGSERYGFDLEGANNICTPPDGLLKHDPALLGQCHSWAQAFAQVEVKTAQFIAQLDIFTAAQLLYMAELRNTTRAIRDFVLSKEFEARIAFAIDKVQTLTDAISQRLQQEKVVAAKTRLDTAIAGLKSRASDLQTNLDSNIEKMQNYLEQCNHLFLGVGERNEYLLDVCAQKSSACIESPVAGHVSCCCAYHPFTAFGDNARATAIEGISGFPYPARVAAGRRLQAGNKDVFEICQEAWSAAGPTVREIFTTIRETDPATLDNYLRQVQNEYSGYCQYEGVSSDIPDDIYDGSIANSAWSLTSSASFILLILVFFI